MSLFSAINQERPYEQFLRNWTEPRIWEWGENSCQRDCKQWRYNKGFNRTRREKTWVRKEKSLYKKFQGGIRGNPLPV